MRITIALAVLLVSGGIFLASCYPAYAQEDDIGRSLIHPAHPFYFLKGLRENMEMAFAPSHRVKILRQLEFAQRRLREAKALIYLRQEDLLQATLERYWWHWKNVLSSRPRDEVFTQDIRRSLTTHLQVLQKMLSQTQVPKSKMSIRATLSRIILEGDLEEGVKRLGCNLLAREATSSGFNEIETVVYKERAEKCFEGLRLQL